MARQVQLDRRVRFLGARSARHRHGHALFGVRRRRMRLAQPDRQVDPGDAVIILRLPGKLHAVLRARLRQSDKLDRGDRIRQHLEPVARPLAPPAHADARVACDRRLGFPRAVGRRDKLRVLVTRAFHHEARRRSRLGAQGHFRTLRYTDILAAGLQEDRRPPGMLRRRHPGLDDHLVGADQRAVIRKQRPHHPARAITARQHRKHDHGRRQNRAQHVGIKRLPFRAEPRKPQVLQLGQQPCPVRLPETGRRRRRMRGPVLQRCQGPQLGRRFQQPRGFRFVRLRITLQPAPGQDAAKDQQRGRDQRRRNLVEPVEPAGQRCGQEQHEQNEHRPEGTPQRQQREAALRRGNLGRDLCQATVVSHSGTFSSPTDSSKLGRLRTISNRSPSTSTSGTSGRAL